MVRKNDIDIVGINAGIYESEVITKDMACEVSSTIKDIVYPSDSEDNKVYTNINNRVDIPSIGIIISKIGNICKVLLYGKCDLIFTGIVTGKTVFLGIDGQPTQTKPTTGYMQILGFAYETGKIFVNPNYIRAKFNPF